MRHRSLLVGLLCAGLALSASSFSSVPQDDEETTPLQDAMGRLQDGQRSLRRLVRDPSRKDDILRTVGDMQQAALDAFALSPPLPEEEVDEQEWRIGFQRQMLNALDRMLALELAAHQGDAEAMKAAYDALSEAKQTGHDTYQR